jgi:hypothetical protein
MDIVTSKGMEKDTKTENQGTKVTTTNLTRKTHMVATNNNPTKPVLSRRLVDYVVVTILTEMAEKAVRHTEKPVTNVNVQDTSRACADQKNARLLSTM